MPHSQGYVEIEISADLSIQEITPEDLPSIFDKSYRGEAAKQTAGLGLGLYISRLLVEAHGGRLTAESVVGEGSTFSFTVPLVSVEDLLEP